MKPNPDSALGIALAAIEKHHAPATEELLCALPDRVLEIVDELCDALTDLVVAVEDVVDIDRAFADAERVWKAQGHRGDITAMFLAGHAGLHRFVHDYLTQRSVKEDPDATDA